MRLGSTDWNHTCWIGSLFLSIFIVAASEVFPARFNGENASVGELQHTKFQNRDSGAPSSFVQPDGWLLLLGNGEGAGIESNFVEACTVPGKLDAALL